MARVRYSVRTERDLMLVADYTLKRWGEDQVIRYLDGLEECCQKLAVSPALGRACDDIRPGLRRMEHEKHVIFYREQADGIWSRVSCIKPCCRDGSRWTMTRRNGFR